MEIITESAISTNTDIIKKISSALYSITDLDKFLDIITKVTLDTLNLSNANIYLFTQGNEGVVLHEKVKIDESQFCIPLVSQGNMVGTLIFETKKELAPAGLKFISDFADLVAASISIALDIQSKINKSSIQQYLISSIRTGVISINSEKIIISFNRQVENILGLRGEEICGKPVEVLPQEISDRLILSLEKGIIKDKEDLYLFSQNIPINITTSRIIDKNNQVFGATMLLTDLRDRYHKGYFKEILRDEIRRSKRYGHQFCIVFVHLEEIDESGRKTTPLYTIETINQITMYINKTIRESDKAIRYSINEIAILLPETDSNGALGFVQRFKKGFPRHDALEKTVISIGISCYPVDGTTSEDLIQTSITSFYKAMAFNPGIIKTPNS